MQRRAIAEHRSGHPVAIAQKDAFDDLAAREFAKGCSFNARLLQLQSPFYLR
jgi:hypothetical protein